MNLYASSGKFYLKSNLNYSWILVRVVIKFLRFRSTPEPTQFPNIISTTNWKYVKQLIEVLEKKISIIHNHHFSNLFISRCQETIPGFLRNQSILSFFINFIITHIRHVCHSEVSLCALTNWCYWPYLWVRTTFSRV